MIDRLLKTTSIQSIYMCVHYQLACSVFTLLLRSLPVRNRSETIRETIFQFSFSSRSSLLLLSLHSPPSPPLTPLCVCVIDTLPFGVHSTAVTLVSLASRNTVNSPLRLCRTPPTPLSLSSWLFNSLQPDSVLRPLLPHPLPSVSVSLLPPPLLLLLLPLPLPSLRPPPPHQRPQQHQRHLRHLLHSYLQARCAH